MIKVENNVVYDEANQLTCDIYSPSDTTIAHKALIFWHGGGWIRGDKQDVKNLTTAIVAQGFTTFVPNYRLAPKNTFPAAHHDAINFANWLLKSKYISQETLSIAQIGASSGGTLALQLAGMFGFPTVTWSAPVNFSDWLKNHNSTKPALDAKNELGLTDQSEINNCFYKYFTLTYAGSNDWQKLTKLDAKSYNYQNLADLLMFNSAAELTPLTDVLDFIDSLASQNHGVTLQIIPGDKHAMAYASQYLSASLSYLTHSLQKLNN
ncbi:alpha/beta hydrolase [Lactobacillus sp. ESL0684]|uniref:alpha/beta hydrolase n=1 Tax=Lactobacillus sp. ESL0684 TaxID=2983213 RepID=UPI0023F807C0|nr:alpha/beta hydrolase [Lactobacillus sp. ESL0684]WEV43901.1 alpha/beta hydrolase [Lactobacillus sp. ESL0684]